VGLGGGWYGLAGRVERFSTGLNAGFSAGRLKGSGAGEGAGRAMTTTNFPTANRQLQAVVALVDMLEALDAGEDGPSLDL
jgi:hypothetical protein